MQNLLHIINTFKVQNSIKNAILILLILFQLRIQPTGIATNAVAPRNEIATCEFTYFNKLTPQHFLFADRRETERGKVNRTHTQRKSNYITQLVFGTITSFIQFNSSISPLPLFINIVSIKRCHPKAKCRIGWTRTWTTYQHTQRVKSWSMWNTRELYNYLTNKQLKVATATYLFMRM